MFDHDIDMQIVLKTILKVCFFFFLLHQSSLEHHITYHVDNRTRERQDFFFLISQKKDNMF